MNIWLSETMVRAVGWTLVHFVWVGLVIAGVLAVALRVMRRSPAHWRYLASCAAMLAMAVAPLVTFQLVLGQDTPPSVVPTSPDAPVVPGQPVLMTERTAPDPAATLSGALSHTPALVGDDVRSLKFVRLFGHQLATPYVVSYFIDELPRLEAWMPWLVTGWLVGVCLLSCRLLAGWWQVRRLARKGCGAAGDIWEQKLAELARRLGLNRSIRLLQSALVEVPTVVGWLRPMILLPASCLTGLSPGQLEAILAHELAHIRRHDYLINLLQSAVETLLFYHPAVWWVSRKVREERENCCDDLAVAISGDRVGYARALATLEELRPASAQLTLAASGAPLLRRIRRLAGKPERGASRASWPVVGIILLLGLGLVVLGMREHRAQAAEQGTASIATVAATAPGTNSIGTSAAEPSDTNAVEVNDLLQQGRFQYEAHQWDEAAAKFIQVLAKDQKNVSAEHYLELIQEKRDLEPAMFPSNGVQPASANPPPSNSFARQTNVVNTSPARKLIFDKLNALRIDHLDYDDIPLKDVVDDLSAKARAADPDGKGINFFLSRETPVANLNSTLDAQGGPVGAPLPGQPDIASVKVQVSLKNITFSDALDAILKSADQPIKYSVLDYGIMFSLRTNEPVPLQIRNFKVDWNNLQSGFADAAEDISKVVIGGGFGGGPNGTTNYGSIPFTSVVTPAGRVEQQVRAYFAAAGIDLSTNSGKAVIWNDRKGILTIRATSDDLDLIEKALQVPNTSAPATNAANSPAASRAPYRPSPNTNLQAISARLDEIRVDANYPNMPLWDVLDGLHRRTQAADPAGQGINFVFNRIDPNAAASANGAPATVHLAMQNVPARQVLSAIVSGSSRAVWYSVTDYGVVFSLVDTNRPPELQVRNFLITNSGFATALRAATGTALSSRREAVQSAVRKYFAAQGIDLSTNTGKAVIYNEQTGILTIRATVHDLEAIQTDILKQNLGPAGSPSADGNAVPLEIRSFKVDGNIFSNGSPFGIKGGNFGGTTSNGFGGLGAGVAQLGGNIENPLREFFAAVGIDLSTNNGKAVIWNEREGMLTVKATKEDLDLIEKALAVVNTVHPLVNLKVKFIEIAQNDTRAFGFPWQRGGIVVGPGGPINPAATNANPLGSFPGTTNLPQGTTVTPTSIAPTPDIAAGLRNQQNAPAIASITGVLTRQQYATVLQAFERRTGAEIFAAPEVTTESGRQAQMQAVGIRAIVTNSRLINGATAVATNTTGGVAGATNPASSPGTITYSFGPELDVVPYVTADENAIQMALIPSITDFIGDTNSGQFVPQAAIPIGGTITAVLPLPHFQLRQAVTSATVWDGETVALSGGLSDSTNAAGRPVKKNLMIFVTVTLVNPDGTRFHSDEEMDALQATPPPPQK